MAREIQATVQATIDRHAERYPLAHVSSWIARHRAAEPASLLAPADENAAGAS
jgi:hypothetical protein